MRGFILTALLAVTGPLALEECISLARSSDRTLRQREITVSESRSKAALSVLDWIPEISVGAGNDFNWGRSVDMQELLIVDNRMTVTSSFSASASLSLTKGYCNLLRRSSGKAEEKMAGFSLEQAAAELDAAVTEAFFQVLLCRQAGEIAERNCIEIEAELRSAAVEAESGSKAKADLYELEAQVCRERAALAEARNKLKLAGMTLNDYLNLPPEEEIELLPPTGDSVPAPLMNRNMIEERAERSPSAGMAEAKLEMDRLELRLAKAAFLPSLTVAGGCGTYYSSTGGGGFMDQISGNVNPSAGVALSIPILGGSGNARALAAAKAELARQELETEKVRRESVAAIREGVAVAADLYENYLAAEAGLKAAGKVEGIAHERHSAGEIPGSEYLAARNRRLRAEAGLLQARYRYLLQLKLLECRYGLKAY